MDVPILTGKCFLHTQQFIEEPKRMNGPGNSTKSLQKSVQKYLFFFRCVSWGSDRLATIITRVWVSF